MGRLIYFDCIGGAGGDMILGALISLGVKVEDIKEGIASLKLGGYAIRTWKEKRMGIEGMRLRVEVQEGQPMRHYHDLEEILSAGSLDGQVRDLALDVFSRLADAEAAVHGTDKNHVHFHEVGAIDSVVDIVGSVLALSMLNVDRVMVSPLPLGRGFIQSEHGVLPLPAPASLELLKGVPVYGTNVEGEMVTPTAAALLTSFAHEFGPFPLMRPERVGYGIGSRNWPDRPNALRAVMGSSECDSAQEVTVIECNLDDMNPELYSPLVDKLLEQSALDVSLIPAQMKKGRPGTQIQVLCRHGDREKIMELIFNETTTIGLRYHTALRRTLPRDTLVIETPLGPVQVKKVVKLDGEIVYYPEFEACKRLAQEKNLPLRKVYRLVEAALTHLEKA